MGIELAIPTMGKYQSPNDICFFFEKKVSHI